MALPTSSTPTASGQTPTSPSSPAQPSPLPIPAQASGTTAGQPSPIGQGSPLKAPGAKIINFGPTGTGKTHALSTIPSHYKVRCIFLEAGMDTLGRAFADRKPPQKIPPHFAWQHIKMQEANLADFTKMTNNINLYDLEGLTRLPINLMGKEANPAFTRFLGAMTNFTDDRTGEVCGPADSWGNDVVLVVETLSALTDAMTRLQVGLKPIKSMADWQIIQNHLERLINMLANLQCHVILTGHWEKEPNEVTGAMDITLSTAGKKLAPKIPRFWSDCILSRRVNNQFFWSTSTNGADLKTRHLALNDMIVPNYGDLLANWRRFAEAGA